MSGDQEHTSDLPPPAAAYIVGHHPHLLSSALDAMDAEVRAGMSPMEGRPFYRGVYAELGRSLRTLAVGKAVDAGILVEVRRVADCYGRYARRLFSGYQDPPHTPDPRAYRRCRRTSELLAELTVHLVTGPGDLQRWFAFGTAFGRFNRFGHGSMARPDRDVDAYLDPVRASLNALLSTTNLRALQELDELLRPGLVTKEWGYEIVGGPSLRYMHSTQCGYRLLNVLKGERPAEPLLMLDENRVVYLGKERRLSDLPRSCAAALWVLAEHAGHPVNRSTILKEGKIQGDVSTLPPIISRLRRALDEIAGVDRGSRRREGIITGTRNAVMKLDGMYRLDIDPRRVTVVPPRPTWMPHGPSEKA